GLGVGRDVGDDHMSDRTIVEFEAAGQRHVHHWLARRMARRMAVAAGSDGGDPIGTALDQRLGRSRAHGHRNHHHGANRSRRGTRSRDYAHRTTPADGPYCPAMKDQMRWFWRISSAARSPMTTQVAIVFPVVTRGMIDASATCRLSMP